MIRAPSAPRSGRSLHLADCEVRPWKGLPYHWLLLPPPLPPKLEAHLRTQHTGPQGGSFLVPGLGIRVGSKQTTAMAAVRVDYVNAYSGYVRHV